jgi:predicted nucleotidyltransferase
MIGKYPFPMLILQQFTTKRPLGRLSPQRETSRPRFSSCKCHDKIQCAQAYAKPPRKKDGQGEVPMYDIETAVLTLKPTRYPEIDAIREATLLELVARLQELEGDNLLQVILYGSVARGEAQEDSDTDVFILLRDSRGGSIQDIIDRIIGITVDINMNTGECRTYIAPNVEILEEYNDPWRRERFYLNLKKDGVTLYDANRF